MKKTKNRNYIEYEERIINSFITLSKKNKWKTPSVTDIVEHARMTRPTFYLHFKSIEDIYKKLQEQIINKYVKFFGTDWKVRVLNLLQSNLDLANIIKQNEDMFKCFMHNTEMMDKFVVDLTEKLCHQITSPKDVKAYYNKSNLSTGWWDWLISYTIIRVEFDTYVGFLKGNYDQIVDYEFLAYWCANISYNLIHGTWERLGIKVEKRDYLAEYLAKKNKK